MSQSGQAALEVIERQIKELDAIVSAASTDLNTVAAKERLGKWKVRTVALLAQNMGEAEGKRFGKIDPGPSFTNDLLEEITDEAETYRNVLTAMVRDLNKTAGA